MVQTITKGAAGQLFFCPKTTGFSEGQALSFPHLKIIAQIRKK
jgi:hypothetical protein